MLFLNSRTANGPTVSIGMQDRSCTQKMGHLFIICGCLSIVIGLILIVLGITSETKTTTFIGIGIISLGVAFFLMTLVCLYGKLDIYYNNWIYRSRVLPINSTIRQATPAHTISHLPVEIQKHSFEKPSSNLAPITIMSEVETNRLSQPPISQVKIINGVT